jgi:phosphoribosylanthranilate isomerase
MFPVPPRVKICCIASEAEAALAVSMGASAIGLVSRMPSGPGPIPESRIRDIARTVPPGVSTFLLTSETTAEPIIAQQQYTGANTLQLVDEVAPSVYAALRDALPGVRIVQVVHVRDERALAEARQLSLLVDAILLDSGNPSLSIKELGGTGRAHDWAVSRKIRDAVQIPIYLAGGLNLGNVGQAIAQVQPFGVDVCSGLRTDGHLDASKLQQFMRAVGESGLTSSSLPRGEQPA